MKILTAMPSQVRVPIWKLRETATTKTLESNMAAQRINISETEVTYCVLALLFVRVSNTVVQYFVILVDIT